MLLAGIAAGLIALGIAVLPGMHAAVQPELSPAPVLEVQTEALGLSSQEVEQYITVPLENNLLDGVMGVWDVRSQSTPGLSTVDLYFEPGTTVLHARQLVEERLTNAFSLPNVAKPPQLIQPLSSSSRVLMIGLNSTNARQLPPLQLSYLARWVVKPRISAVPGVANVAIFGQQDRQIQVEVDPSTLAARRITLQQVIDTAGNSQLVSPLSYLEGAAPGTGGFIDGPNQRLDIRPVLPLGVPNMSKVPISDAPGKPTLGSVAKVIESHQPLIGDALTKRGSGLILLVQMLPGSSVTGVTKGVEQALSDLRPGLKDVSIDTSFFKPASYVSSALDNLALALVIAGILAIVALGALLAQARAAFIAALSAALSLIVAALALQALGYTLNALVVLGLLIAAVVVVDDTVVSTHGMLAALRDRKEHDAAETVIASLSPLRRMSTYAAVILLLLIGPVFFAKGVTAIFLHPMVLSFALAVLASLIVASTIAPACAMLLFERFGAGERTLRPLARLEDGYTRALTWVLSIPRGRIAAVCAIGLIGWLAVPFLSQPAPLRFKDRNLVVQWTGPSGASLGEMNRVTSRALGDLRRLPSVGAAAATLGRAVTGDQIVDTNSGQLYVELKPNADYDSALSAVRSVVGSYPGMHASVSSYQSDVEAGVLSPSSRDVSVRVYGENFATLRGIAGRIQGAMSHVAGLGRPQIQLPAQQPNIEVAINSAAAHNAGVLPGDARRQASTLVSGLTVGNFFEQQAVFDAVVIGVPSVRDSLTAVRHLLIDTANGGHVLLGSIASVSVRPDPIDVEHEALSRFVDVTAPVRSGSVGAARAAIQQQLSKLAYPLDYHAEVVGGTPESPTSHTKFLTFVLAAAVGILLLLQAALGSWRLAAMFILALPVALVGGLLVALITGQATSLGADAGLVAVFALALRRGMLQLGAIRRTHEQDGGPLTGALVLKAARQQVTISLAVSGVIAAALLPFIVMGDVAGNELTHTMADVTFGGLISTAILTQLLVPALYLALGPTAPIEIESTEETVEPEPVPAGMAGTS